MTASTLYEAIEPHILWKQLLIVMFAEITGDRKDIEVCGLHVYTQVWISDTQTIAFRQYVWSSSYLKPFHRMMKYKRYTSP